MGVGGSCCQISKENYNVIQKNTDSTDEHVEGTENRLKGREENDLEISDVNSRERVEVINLQDEGK
jgi:hypothetical protein